MIFHIFCILNVFHLYEHSDVVQGYVHFLKDLPRVARDWLSCDTSIGVLPQKFCYSADRKHGLSPEWYFPREPSCVNDLLHCLHEKDLFPVWTTLCIFRIGLVLKYFSQKRQTNSDFCFVWTLIWCFNCPASRKVLFQCWKKNAFLQNDAFHASQECLLVWMICCNICM